MRVTLGTVLVCALALVSSASAAPVTINYPNQTLNTTWTVGHFSEVWDLTASDLTLRYRLDLTGITAGALDGWMDWVEVGLRQVGYGDFNPGPWNTYQGGAGGWMVSHVNNLTANPNSLNINDKHNLAASGGRGETDYDATNPNTITGPFGTTVNYGIWFDRDGVDTWQATYWGSLNGQTYNTGGVYDIVISYHAVNQGLGTMFATVNGVPTGFWTGGWKNAQPEIYPAGLSFKGDMTQMQVFYGIASQYQGGYATLQNISVTGTPVPEPASLVLLGTGLAGLARLAARRRK